MKADTTRRPLRPEWAKALRMKWTRQRCQVAVKIRDTAASIGARLRAQKARKRARF
jgi:hypothetical protein